MDFNYEKSLLYSVLLGNGKLNVALGNTLEVRRFFYPIDEVHDVILKLGLYEKQLNSPAKKLRWIELEEKDASLNGFILSTGYFNMFVDAYEPIFALKINHGGESALLWKMRIGTTSIGSGVEYTDGIFLFYKRNYCFGMKGDFLDYACGYGNLVEELESGCLDRNRFAMKDCGAAAILEPNAKVLIAAGLSSKEILNVLEKAESYEEMEKRTAEFWQNNADGDKLIRASRYVFRVLQHENGAIIAAPEIDPEFRYCGGYGFSWVRDCSYVAKALTCLNEQERAKRLLQWIAGVGIRGEFRQRYYTNGNPAPSWSLQLDQAGTFIWAVWEYWKAFEDDKFVKEIAKEIRSCADYIANCTKIPLPQTDLWEERKSFHAYTYASAYCGLIKAHQMLGDLGLAEERWLHDANSIKAAFSERFWEKHSKRFMRSVDVSARDSTVDSSLIGIAVPFEVIEPKDERMLSTIKTIEKRLMTEAGLMRYEFDVYPRGESAWPLCTAWLAWYYKVIGENERASALLEKVEKCANRFGFLPEQVDTAFKPKWVIPLSWSHAMYVIAKRA
ncbi:MAG: glycoside hydrolase family 15 protein [Candidatus Micrarchaeia archaeon]